MFVDDYNNDLMHNKTFYASHCFYTPVEDGTHYGITRGGRAVFFFFKLELCMMHISHTLLAGVMKFQHKYTAIIFSQGQKFLHYYFSIPPLYDHYDPTLQLGVRWVYLATICRSCFFFLTRLSTKCLG